MSKNQKNTKNNKKQKPKKNWLFPAIVAAAIVAVVLIVVSQNGAAATGSVSAQAPAQSVQAAGSAIQKADGNGPGITINKKDITSAATFIPYQIGSTKMELIAVKADDGTIRTSLNTCQVCWDSGRGYYKQQGNELVCQNCGNRFNINQIEKIKNGCNPVPITSDQKTENSDTVTITGDTIATFAHYFQR